MLGHLKFVSLSKLVKFEFILTLIKLHNPSQVNP